MHNRSAISLFGRRCLSSSRISSSRLVRASGSIRSPADGGTARGTCAFLIDAGASPFSNASSTRRTKASVSSLLRTRWSISAMTGPASTNGRTKPPGEARPTAASRASSASPVSPCFSRARDSRAAASIVWQSNRHIVLRSRIVRSNSTALLRFCPDPVAISTLAWVIEGVSSHMNRDDGSSASWNDKAHGATSVTSPRRTASRARQESATCQCSEAFDSRAKLISRSIVCSALCASPASCCASASPANESTTARGSSTYGDRSAAVKPSIARGRSCE